MNPHITAYNNSQANDVRKICELLAGEIQKALPEATNKIWHGGPVWFDNGNPLVGYWNRKNGVQLMFWSGMSFDEPNLDPIGDTGKWKTAGKKYASVDDIDKKALANWLKKSQEIQWDYKNVIKRRGILERLK